MKIPGFWGVFIGISWLRSLILGQDEPLRDAVSTAAHGGGSERHGAGHGPVGALDVAGYKDPALRPLAEKHG